MFASWANFYMLLGEASASLIGLLFIVSTLTAGLERTTVTTGTGLFLTPTVFKFATVVAISATALAPGLTDLDARCLLLLIAAVGGLNLGSVARSLFQGKAPGTVHWSDPWCYGVAPALAFLALAVAALWPDPVLAARGAGFIAATLLLVGVRNAWDLVTTLAFTARQRNAPAATTPETAADVASPDNAA